MAGLVFGSALAVVAVFAWVGLDPKVRDWFTTSQRITLIGFAVLIALTFHALTRCKVIADQQGLTVVNGFRTRRFPWAAIVTIRLTQGAPWATLDLADGTAVPAMGIQGSDGARARHAVAEIRRLINH